MISGADLAAAVERGLQCKGHPFYGAEMSLHIGVPDAFPTVEVWDDEWGMLVCIVCCDAEWQQQAARCYGERFAERREYEVVVKVMWPKGWEEEET